VRFGALGLAIAAVLLPSVVARADDAHGGALTAHALIGNSKEPELGGATLVDLWFVDGSLRVGAVAGLGFLGGDADESRVLGPFGASVAVASRPAPVGFSLRLRAGGWAGAMDQGFAGGGWLAAGFHIEYALDPRVALTAGMDAWFLFGHGDATAFAPGISLVFLPGES
jgi:hypothetical protein